MSFWDQFKSEHSFEYEVQNETVIENVEKAGYEVLEATDKQLFLDIDSDEQYELFLDKFKLFQGFFNKVYFHERPSIGGLPGRHIIVELVEPMSALERICWQASMGSDPKKEFNNLLGVHFDIPHHIVLFNRKKGTSSRRFPNQKQLGVKRNYYSEEDIPF